MPKEIQLVITLVLHVEEDKWQEKLNQIQDRIKDVIEIREYGFNLYDLITPLNISGGNFNLKGEANA